MLNYASAWDNICTTGSSTSVPSLPFPLLVPLESKGSFWPLPQRNRLVTPAPPGTRTTALSFSRCNSGGIDNIVEESKWPERIILE